ncbi:YheC/YheD family protein [Alteribacter aurantiacus]|uniref:YheC/YheD family endospore coat-associated protein n=1 Tax=Alteribacter aurantiacus TaxID=254410 RepID=UPI000406C7E2|nr:YheC/YheD family protein [Alteribacter aurantiacus]
MTKATETVRLGVLISPSQSKVLKRKMKLDKRYSFLSALASEASELDNMNVYYFSPEDVDIKLGRVTRALFWDKTLKKWFECSADIPQVVYERIYVKNDAVEKVRSYFNKQCIPFINSEASFNKLLCHEKLAVDKSASPYLPPTIKVRRLEDIHRFLQRHKVVYLKKVVSSLGKGVIKVEKKDDKTIQYSYHKKRLRSETIHNIHELTPVLDRFFYNKTYIAQKGIALLKIDNQSIDFRAEVQRGEDGLIISGVSARVGLENSPITIHSIAIPYEKFLKKKLEYTDEKVAETVRKVETFLRTIYTALENAYGSFGEIGIDFGIDTNGDIWFIEANSKSAKVSFEKSYGEDGLKANASRLLAYAASLHKSEVRS